MRTQSIYMSIEHRLHVCTSADGPVRRHIAPIPTIVCISIRLIDLCNCRLFHWAVCTVRGHGGHAELLRTNYNLAVRCPLLAAAFCHLVHLLI